MKLQYLFIFFLIITFKGNSQTKKFEKPRYLKYSTLLCPIDITKSYDISGLLKANVETILINPKIILVEAEDESGKDIMVKKEVNDTILLKTILIEKGYAFDVIQEIGGYSIIKFWNLDQSTASGWIKKLTGTRGAIPIEQYDLLDLNSLFNKANVKGLIANVNGKNYDLTKNYYILPTETLENNSVEFENKTNLWSIGLLVLPVRVRPFATESGQFDFSDGFSVGTTFAWTVHHNWRTNFTHNFLIYAGVSSYKADESKIKETRDDYTIATFSPALGWMWEKNNVQLSILSGIDFPPGNLQKQWVYRNMPWFGIGVGIGLFKIDNEESSKGTNKQLE